MGQGVPLSQPIESAKAAGRGVRMIGVMLFSFMLAGIASAAWQYGWFVWFLAVELVVAAVIYLVLSRVIKNSRWPSME
jgi:hypothetical protein